MDANGNSHPHGLYKNQTNSFASWDHVTLYRNGVLMWGTKLSRTPTPTFTPTATLTQGPGACSPVSAVITAPFQFDGAGTFCWQVSSLSFINSWNLVT
jgi:hypothetical protein